MTPFLEDDEASLTGDPSFCKWLTSIFKPWNGQLEREQKTRSLGDKNYNDHGS